MLPDIANSNFGGVVEVPTEMHIACVLLLDTSGSMNGDSIDSLNEGVKAFKNQIINDPTLDPTTKKCIDIAIITFGPDVVVQQGFKPVEQMVVDEFTADGGTPMGEALEKAMELIEGQKQLYKSKNVDYYRPWIFCITDGGPNDDYRDAATKLKDMESRKKVLSYCIGVPGFDVNCMKSIYSEVYQIKSVDFPKVFKFLSTSLVVQQTSKTHEETGFLTKM